MKLSCSNIVFLFQARHTEIVSRQAEMDSVSEKAQSLLETNSDARVSHSITQMTTKYQALLSTSKDGTRKAETQCNEHRNYIVAAEDFNTWLNSTKEKVSVLINVVGTREELESRLTRIRVRTVYYYFLDFLCGRHLINCL